jgi:heme-degrading monooxygenase HmoA
LPKSWQRLEPEIDPAARRVTTDVRVHDGDHLVVPLGSPAKKTERQMGAERNRLRMIIREWRGRASPSNADAYPAHFRAHVLPELRRVPGFLGAELSRRQIGDKIEFLVLTRWQTIGAIQDFAGSEIAKAVVEPGAIAALLDYDRSVQHYEVIEDVPT